MKHNVLLSIPFFAVLTACASVSTVPPERLASNEAAIKSADAVGAAKFPQAALHLRLAQEEMAQASQFAKDGNAERAELWVQRSIADADLALSLTRVEEAKADAEKAHAAVVSIQGSAS